MTKFKTSASMAFLILVAVVMLFPIYWLFVSAAKTNGELFGGNALLPPSHIVIGGNYQVLVGYESGAFWLWFRNSMIYALGTALVGTYLCAMTGYALAKLTFPGKKAILGFVLGGLMVPTTVLIIPIFIMEHDLHLTNTFAGVILPLVVSPFGVYFIWAFSVDGVSRSIIDSGRVDGAGEVRIFNRIVLPILVPALVTLFLILFIGTWNNYFPSFGAAPSVIAVPAYRRFGHDPEPRPTGTGCELLLRLAPGRGHLSPAHAGAVSLPSEIRGPRLDIRVGHRGVARRRWPEQSRGCPYGLFAGRSVRLLKANV